MEHPTWLEIDLGAVAHNTHAVLARTRSALMAVVKANAYGLGAVEIARTALSTGAVWLAVARVNEAQVLRSAGITAPILVFSPALGDEIDWAIHAGVTLTLHSQQSAELLADRARAANRAVSIHLKVDTGFGRFGILPEETLALVHRVVAAGHVHIDGIYSHLAMADEEPGHPLTAVQLERFNSALGALHAAGIQPQWVHCSNSAAAWSIPAAHFNLVRAGTALVGMKPEYFSPFPVELRRVVSWKARLLSCKQLPPGWRVGYGQTYQAAQGDWIGVVPVGYADGFRRVGNNQVLTAGRRVDVVGRVTCDVCMIRLSQPLPEGAEIVLIGNQGDESITTDELIARWNTSQADVLSNINARVFRKYLSD